MKHYITLASILFLHSCINAMEVHLKDKSIVTLKQISSENMHDKIEDINNVQLLMRTIYSPYQLKYMSAKDTEYYIAQSFFDNVSNLMNNKSQLYVAKDGNKLVGFISWNLPDKYKFVSLSNLAVMENYRKKGLGKALVQLPFSQMKNIKGINTSCYTSYDDAITFFHKIGFKDDVQFGAYHFKDLIHLAKIK